MSLYGKSGEIMQGMSQGKGLFPMFYVFEGPLSMKFILTIPQILLSIITLIDYLSGT